MATPQGSWSGLVARLSTTGGFDLTILRQAALRRQVAARLRCHGLASYDEYARLLDAEPAEYGELARALRAAIRPADAAGPAAAARVHERPEPAALYAADRRGRYHELFEAATVPLVVTDLHGAIQDANARGRDLLARGEAVLGSRLVDHLAPRSLAAYAEALDALARQGQVELQMQLRRQPGRVYQATARHAAGDGETLIGWTLRDVTDSLDLDRLREEMTDVVLHDLRSPLATAVLGLEAAERALERGDPGRVRRALDMTQAALRRAGRLAESLLEASRLQGGQMPLQLAPVDPGELSAAAATEVTLAAVARGQHLQLDVQPGLEAITADRDMLLRALISLLDNAIKFSPPASEIRLRAAAQGRDLCIAVSDQGPGIAPEMLPRIFDKFVGLRLPGAPRGYGLGLAFCKLAAEAHGGCVTVDTSPGCGSTFTIRLPRQPGQAPQATREG